MKEIPEDCVECDACEGITPKIEATWVDCCGWVCLECRHEKKEGYI